MNREIGSEFWDIPICSEDNHLFPLETQWFLSGRFALKAIIDEIQIHSVGVPMWCCDSIIKPFADKGIDVQFYDSQIPNTDAILVMDFFGYTSQTDWDKFDGIVIRDVTHSILSKKYDDADYYFGSLRKWAGFWTGGFAWGFQKDVVFGNSNDTYIELRRTAMIQKQAYIHRQAGCQNSRNEEKEFLKLFCNAENQLDEAGVLPAASRDIAYAKKMDIHLIRSRRRDNANILLEAFNDIALFPFFGEKDCPMFVPIRIPYRDGLRKHLINKGIYCPVHWPVSTLHKVNDEQKRFYDTELSLVCDQRYDQTDMERIISVIKEYQEKR